MSRTLFEKLWDPHAVVTRDDGMALLYVDRHLLHEGSRFSFDEIAAKGYDVRRRERTVACADHYVPTRDREKGPAGIAEPEIRLAVESLYTNTRAKKIRLFGMEDRQQGIVHVVGPEQGLTLPGMTVVCGDSHTSTHGALGALAFGVGHTDCALVLATQCVWTRKPRRLRLEVTGRLRGATSKDLALAIIARLGASGATGFAVEYCGDAITALTMEQRMTLCNMSIEMGARVGMIAPDEVTFAYVEGRPYAPRGAMWERALDHWRTLPTEVGAGFDREEAIDGDAVEPMVTWGTSPEDAVPISGLVPDPAAEPSPSRRARKERALSYMGLEPGTRITDIAIDRVFIGSCTNSRIEDLRAAAAVLAGRRSAVPGMVVPGSGLVKEAAEREGLDRIFLEAGLEWRDPGCSMCLGLNGDTIASQERCASTTNRNFEGRQGRGGRTHLVSPVMAAAAAVSGHFVDVRNF